MNGNDIGPDEAVALLRRVLATTPKSLERAIAVAGDASGFEPRDIVTLGSLLGATKLLVEAARGSAPVVQGHAGVAEFLHELAIRLDNPKRRLQNPVVQSRIDDRLFELIESLVRERHSQHEFPLDEVFDLFDVPPRLSRLEELVNAHANSLDLSDCFIVAHQHLLGSVVSQFRALWRLGLNPHNTYIFGKPYSTNRLAALALTRSGAVVRTGLEGFHSDDVLDPHWYQNVHYDELSSFLRRALDEAVSRKCRRIIVLDDGGQMLARISRSLIGGPDPASIATHVGSARVFGVEQTTFGRRLLDGFDLFPHRSWRAIPVANVAGSRLKLERESQLIAKSVIAETRHFLAASDHSEGLPSLGGSTVGVIGFGAVGAWLYRELATEPDRFRAPRSVLCFDHDTAKTSIARSVGYGVAQSARDLVRKCDIIIGCTGDRSGVELGNADFDSDTVLVSASSGSHEFSRLFAANRQARPELNPDIMPFRRATTFDWVHSNYTLSLDRASVHVLNGAFPVNFTGVVDPIVPRDIELTRCLMVEGVVQVLSAKVPRHPESVVFEVELEDSFLAELFEGM